MTYAHAQEETIISDAVLLRGDCTKVLDGLLPNCVDLLWTDPPYGNNNHAGDFNANLNKHRGLENQAIANDDLESMQRVVDAMLTQAVRIVKPDGAVVTCCGGGGGPSPVFAWLANRLDASGLKFFHAVVWDKKNPGLGWKYRRRYEFAMVAHRADGSLGWADDNVAVDNIIDLMPPRQREHPNEKSVTLMEKFISWHTRPGDMVLDPFMGSGSTGVAALNLKRRFIGIELDPKHYATAVRRITEAHKVGGGFF